MSNDSREKIISELEALATDPSLSDLSVREANARLRSTLEEIAQSHKDSGKEACIRTGLAVVSVLQKRIPLAGLLGRHAEDAVDAIRQWVSCPCENCQEKAGAFKHRIEHAAMAHANRAITVSGPWGDPVTSEMIGKMKVNVRDELQRNIASLAYCIASLADGTASSESKHWTYWLGSMPKIECPARKVLVELKKWLADS